MQSVQSRRSPATRNVVQLGPNWFQKEEKKYMNWKTLVPVTLPVKVPHSAAGNKNKMKSAKNPIACNSTHHPSGFRNPMFCNSEIAFKTQRKFIGAQHTCHAKLLALFI